MLEFDIVLIYCARTVDYDCDEPYITEEDLIHQLIAHIENIKVNITMVVPAS